MITEQRDEVGVSRLSKRVTAIAVGSKKSANMDVNVNIPKTKSLHVRQQEEVSETSQEETHSKCKFVCPYPDCGHVFLTTNQKGHES